MQLSYLEISCKRATWSCIREINGQHTIIFPILLPISLWTGINIWKGRDFPNPVGRTAIQSTRSNRHCNTCRCSRFKLWILNFFSTFSIASLVLSFAAIFLQQPNVVCTTDSHWSQKVLPSSQ